MPNIESQQFTPTDLSHPLAGERLSDGCQIAYSSAIGLNMEPARHFESLLNGIPTLEIEDRRAINRAFELMVELHKDQEPRPDGEPYVNHPLRVAIRCIEQFGVTSRDVICASLLHDSVEDQPEKLVLAGGGDPAAFSGEALVTAALEAVQAQFGAKTSRLVSLLTNPDFDSQIAAMRREGDTRPDAALKNAAYKDHFFEIYDADPEAFTIKLADFSENALNIGRLSAGRKKEKLLLKYGPVLNEAIRRLEGTEPKVTVTPEFLALLKSTYAASYASTGA